MKRTCNFYVVKHCLSFVFSLVLLTGCAAKAPDETQALKNEATTEITEATAEPTERQWATAATTEDPYDDVPPAVIPAEMATATAEPVILETNWDIDYYCGTRLPQLDFFVISTEPISKENVSMELPIDIPFEYDLALYTNGQAPKEFVDNPGAYVLFSYDHYLHYCDFDWTELAAKYQAMEDARIPLRDGYSAEKQQAFQQAQTEYESFYKQFYNDYLKLDMDMIPQYYCYQVCFYPGVPTEELVLNTIDLTINGKTTTVDIGEVRFHTDTIKRNQSEVNGFIEKQMLGAYSPILELNETYWFTTDFTAKKDLLLTGFEIANDHIEYRGLILQAKGTNFAWDGKMPVDIPAGSLVILEATLTDPRLLQPGFCIKGQVSVEFEVDGITYEHTYEHQFYHAHNPFALYAQHFDGFDFTDYYEKYYYPIVLGSETEN